MEDLFNRKKCLWGLIKIIWYYSYILYYFSFWTLKYQSQTLVNECRITCVVSRRFPMNSWHTTNVKTLHINLSDITVDLQISDSCVPDCHRFIWSFSGSIRALLVTQYGHLLRNSLSKVLNSDISLQMKPKNRRTRHTTPFLRGLP